VYVSNVYFAPQVEISFLMVGHTHEAVDRFFSFINRCLKHKTFTMTTEEMIEFVTQYLVDGRVMEFEDLKYVGDWKKWSEGCGVDLHDHTGKGSPLHFRFARDEEDGDVLMRYKHLHNEQWTPAGGMDIIVKDPEDVLPQPAQYKPFSEQEGYLKGLARTYKKLQAAGFLNEISSSWWKNLLEEKGTDVVPYWFRYESPCNKMFPKKSDGALVLGSGEAVAEQSDGLVDYTEKEMEDFGFSKKKEVYSGKYQNRKKRNDHGCNVGEEMAVGSFVMVKSDDKAEPLLFGFVTKVHGATRTFELHYCGRKTGAKDVVSSSMDVNCAYYRIYNKSKKSKRGEAWVGDASVDSVLMFDILTNKATSMTSTFKLPKKSHTRMMEAIENMGSFAGGAVAPGGRLLDAECVGGDGEGVDGDDSDGEADFEGGGGDSEGEGAGVEGDE
jgi:hypothetical protein